jgi:hypothetical protein
VRREGKEKYEILFEKEKKNNAKYGTPTAAFQRTHGI